MPEKLIQQTQQQKAKLELKVETTDYGWKIQLPIPPSKDRETKTVLYEAQRFRDEPFRIGLLLIQRINGEYHCNSATYNHYIMNQWWEQYPGKDNAGKLEHFYNRDYSPEGVAFELLLKEK